MLDKVKKLWESYRDEENIPISTALLQEEPPSELSNFRRIANDLTKFTRPASQDEYDDYCNGDPCDIGGMSALSWWLQDSKRKRWPKLSLMAIDILSIPAMSDEPERVFSGARRTISWDRSQLGPETIEKIECVKHWVRSGVSREKVD